MTEKPVDPRFDPAFQRGFAGAVDARTEQENAFARPDGSRRARRAAPAAPEDRARIERALGAVMPQPVEPVAVEDVVPTEQVEPERVPPESVELPPLRSNPWFLGLFGLGAVLSIAGYALLYWALATPLASFTGSDSATNAYVLHQMAFYISVPLLGGLPAAGLIALGLLAARWRGRIPPTR